MAERKASDQSWESFTEQRIQEAFEAGEFDHVPGQGEPIPDIDETLDENWWIKKRLRRENASVLPPLLQARLDIEQTRRAIAAFQNEDVVRAELTKLRKRVLDAILSPLPSPPVIVLPVDMEEEVNRWRKSKASLRS